MQPWMTSLGICAAAAAGLVLCLYLFVTLKLEMRAAERRARRELDTAMVAAGQQIDALSGRIAELEQALEEVERNAAGTPARPGVNLTIRTQVLRRRRQGEDPAQIAAALGLPRTEVDLLLKVDRLAMNRI